MIMIAGPNVYKVTYTESAVPGARFVRLVLAESEEEAMSHFGEGVIDAEVMDHDTSLWIPEKFLPPPADGFTTERLKEELNDMMTQWRKFRQPLRDLLSKYGVASNPGWTDQDIVDGIHSIIDKYRVDRELMADMKSELHRLRNSDQSEDESVTEEERINEEALERYPYDWAGGVDINAQARSGYALGQLTLFRRLRKEEEYR